MGKNIIINPSVFIIAVVIAFLPLLFLMTIMVVYTPVSCDPSYYLTIVRHVAEGDLLYSEVECGYTPLYLLFLASIEKIFHLGTNYSFWLTIQMLLCASSTYFIYLIAKHISNSKYIAVFASWLFLSAMLVSEIAGVFLELPSVAVGLIITLLFIKKRNVPVPMLVVYGLLSTLPFWIKQYGIGFTMIYPLLLFDGKDGNKKIWLKLFAYIVGVAFSFVICDVFSKQCLNQIFGSYGTNDVANELYVEKSFLRNIPSAMKTFFVRYFPCVVFMFVPLLHRDRNYDKLNLFLFCALGTLGFFIQFYFNVATHYYQYIVPFCVLLCVYLLADCKYWKNKVLRILFAVLLSFSCISLSYQNIRKGIYREYYCNHIKYESKKSQIDMVDEIKNTIGNDNTINNYVFIKNPETFFVYYLSGFSSAKVNGKYYYGFGPLSFMK